MTRCERMDRAHAWTDVVLDCGCTMRLALESANSTRKNSYWFQFLKGWSSQPTLARRVGAFTNQFETLASNCCLLWSHFIAYYFSHIDLATINNGTPIRCYRSKKALCARPNTAACWRLKFKPHSLGSRLILYVSRFQESICVLQFSSCRPELHRILWIAGCAGNAHNWLRRQRSRSWTPGAGLQP